MGTSSVKKLRIVPPADIAGYEDALREYFSSYRSNVMTFFTVNFATIHTFEVGCLGYPSLFNLADVLDVFDRFFKYDGSVNLKTYKQFLKTSGIVDAERYAHQSTSSRLRDEVLDMGLAVPCPAGRKTVVPDQEHIHAALCKRLSVLSRFLEVCVSRFLPAFHDVIQEQLAAGFTQSEIASALSSKTKRKVSQEDISRFLKKTNEVVMRYERKKQRALMTRDMAEVYIENLALMRSGTTTKASPST